MSSENGPDRRTAAGRGPGAARAHPGDGADGQGAQGQAADLARGRARQGTVRSRGSLVDKGVLHLDRYFDYAVPEELDAGAQPGVRVRVRFGAG